MSVHQWLGLVMSIIVPAAGMAYWLGTKLSRADTKLDEHSAQIESVQSAVDGIAAEVKSDRQQTERNTANLARVLGLLEDDR